MASSSGTDLPRKGQISDEMSLTITKKLGEGSYGVVYEGLMQRSKKDAGERIT